MFIEKIQNHVEIALGDHDVIWEGLHICETDISD
jgi:hypothetical protein